MGNFTSLAMVVLFAVSQIQGQDNGDSTRGVPLASQSAGQQDNTRRQVFTLVCVVSAAASVTAVVLAYRHMSRADAAYDRYLNAGQPSQMDRFFNQATDHDKKAGISLVIFELFFAVTVYSTFSSLTL